MALLSLGVSFCWTSSFKGTIRVQEPEVIVLQLIQTQKNHVYGTVKYWILHLCSSICSSVKHMVYFESQLQSCLFWTQNIPLNTLTDGRKIYLRSAETRDFDPSMFNTSRDRRTMIVQSILKWSGSARLAGKWPKSSKSSNLLRVLFFGASVDTLKSCLKESRLSR